MGAYENEIGTKSSLTGPQEKGPRAGAGGPSLERKRPKLGTSYVRSDVEKCLG
jgi:hypothetical protein